MAYIFEHQNGQYQLVKTRWYWWNKKYDVYLNENSRGKLTLTAKDQKGSATNNYGTTVEASNLVSILKKLGVKKRDLLNAKLPEEIASKAIDQWAHIVTWLSTCRS